MRPPRADAERACAAGARRLRALVASGLLAIGACASTGVDDAADLLSLVARADYAALSARACDRGALAFAPYARNLSRLHLSRLEAAELRRFASIDRLYEWGRYDGSGEPIRLTPLAYHQRFVWDIDYRTRALPQRMGVDQLRTDSDLAAVAQAFPGAEAIVYRYPGAERLDRKDARELILVGRTRPQGWCLLALAHSEDTV